MSKLTDAIEDIMVARYKTQTPEFQLMQSMVANEVNGTKSAAQQEVAKIEEAWEKKASTMHARGVTATDLEWINAYKAYQDDLQSARKWIASIQSAGERMLEKVGRN